MKNHSTCSSFYGLYRPPPESCAVLDLEFYSNMGCNFFVSMYIQYMCICAYMFMYLYRYFLADAYELNRFLV